MRNRWWSAGVTVCPSCGVPVQRFTPVWESKALTEYSAQHLIADPSAPGNRIEALDQQKVQAAVQMLRETLRTPTQSDVRGQARSDPLDWSPQQHFGFGLHVRNLLRDRGFGEEFFEIHNLDDYWGPFVELAFGTVDNT
jgi:hypothetical protein